MNKFLNSITLFYNFKCIKSISIAHILLTIECPDGVTASYHMVAHFSKKWIETAKLAITFSHEVYAIAAQPSAMLV